MRITVTFRADTAAFVESRSAEVARILRDVADCVAMADLNEPFDRRYTIRDSNAEVIGQFRAEGPTNHAVRAL